MALPEVVIYTTPTCGFCRQAKDYLRQKNIPFIEKDVSVDRNAAYEMIRISGQQGVPVIRVGNEIIIGFDRKRLDRVLQSAAEGKASLGVSVADSSRIALEHGVVPIFGAYVGRVAAGSAAERAGLRPGDIITEVNARPIRNAEDLEKAIENLRKGSQVTLVWVRGQDTLRSTVTL